MTPRALRIRTLRRALSVCGSRSSLARLLCIPEPELRRWLDGVEAPPEGIFLAAIDLIDSRFGFVERRRSPRAERFPGFAS